MKDALERYWRERTLREKRVLAWGAAFVLIAIFYAYLWLPLARYRAALVDELPRLRASAAQMRDDATELARLRGVAKRPTGDPQSSVKASLEKIGEATPHVGGDADGRIRVVFESISAEAWLRWITSLAVEHHLHIEAARVEMLESGKDLKATAIVSQGPR